MALTISFIWIFFILFASCSTKFSVEEDGDSESMDGTEDLEGNGERDVVDVDAMDRNGAEDGGEEFSDGDLAPDDGGETDIVRRPCSTPGDCDDDNPCTIDICFTDGFCTYAFQEDGMDCADDTFCNGAETCVSGQCVPPGNPCSVPEDCDEDNDWCRCSDSDPCTANDHMIADVCVGTVTDDLPCGSCDSSSGCFICCAGSCVNANENGRCYSCTNRCTSPENCCFTTGHECGHYWCCCS